MKMKTAPSLQPSLLLEMKYHRNKLVISEKMASRENAAMFTLSGEATKITPKISVMLMKQLPTMFPRAKFI
jgi:hypothetical protein